MKDTVSSFELRHIIAELQELVGAKIEKIFQQEKPLDDFLFSFHVPGKGKRYLFLSLPHALCLSSFKPSFPESPPSFCSSLRRKITNAKITGLVQQGFERIVVIQLMTRHGPSSLIIELFSSGNIILVDENNIILATLHRKIWNENRKIIHGQTYQFPSEQIDPSALTREEFDQLLGTSTKESLVTFLAIDLSLGGTYAEYILSRTSLDKTQAPSSLSSSKELVDEIRNLFSQKTQAVIKDSQAFPIPVVPGDAVDTFNEAIGMILLSKLQKEEQKELAKTQTESLSKFDKVISSQSHQKKGLEESAKKNQEAGELIYTHYQEIKEVLEKIRKLKSYCSWDEIRLELKKYSYVASLDEHNGQLQVEWK